MSKLSAFCVTCLLTANLCLSDLQRAMAQELESLSVSPDGNSLALTMALPNATNIWLLNTDSFEGRRVTDSRSHHSQLKFSPDSSVLAFVETKEGSDSRRLMLLELSTGEVSAATDDLIPVDSYFFFPNGKSISFSEHFTLTDGIEPKNLYRVNIESGRVEQLTTSEFYDSSPIPIDTERILFWRTTRYENYSPIAAKSFHRYAPYILDLRTGTETRLGEHGAYTVVSPTFSDSAQQAIFSDRDELFVVDTTRQSLRPLEIDGIASDISHGTIQTTSDGQFVIFNDYNKGLWVVDTTTGKQSNILDRKNRIKDIALGGNDRRIFFLMHDQKNHAGWTYDLYVIPFDGLHTDGTSPTKISSPQISDFRNELVSEWGRAQYADLIADLDSKIQKLTSIKATFVEAFSDFGWYMATKGDLAISLQEPFPLFLYRSRTESGSFIDVELFESVGEMEHLGDGKYVYIRYNHIEPKEPDRGNRPPQVSRYNPKRFEGNIPQDVPALVGHFIHSITGHYTLEHRPATEEEIRDLLTAEEVAIMHENGTDPYDDARDAEREKLERRYTKDSISRIDIAMQNSEGDSFGTRRIVIYYWNKWGISVQVDRFDDDDRRIMRTRLIHVSIDEPIPSELFEFSLRENETIRDID